MTTEVAVLNRLGVALAADSAVTISGGGAQKVFDTGDKLFELCTRGNDPVGIMINGNMDLFGIPWEILIKAFRDQKRPEATRTMRDWLQCLLDFVSSHQSITPAQEEAFVEAFIADEVRAVQSLTLEKFREVPEGSLPSEFISAAVAERRVLYETAKIADSLNDLASDEVKARYGAQIRSTIGQSLAWLDPRDDELDLLTDIILKALTASERSEASTGIIVAGFCKDDLFPSMAMADVDGGVCGRIRYTHGENFSVDRVDNPAKVISFAQTDVVDRILSGADNRFINESVKYLKSAISKANEGLVDELRAAGLDATAASGLTGDVASQVVNGYKTEFVERARSGFRSSFDQMVAMMPKQDVIELAEALVSITAIERNASSQQATVGGPVDIALITKHEGFVWIKRKHYFDPALNPRFFWRKQRAEASQGDRI
jgi:hypothetical protein